MIGSKYLSGKVDVETLKLLRGTNELSCYERLINFGLDPSPQENYVIHKNDIFGMLELHIEQGIALEEK